MSRELSKRSWCPNCGIERTGDDLTRPCACMARTIRRARRMLPRIAVRDDGVIAMTPETFERMFLA